ncbi:MAG: YHS domain-containing protein [Deltaproteobacteria bacterium]|nr:YHS domain-containing protein [Deltaproteobacteria bacterium]
MAKDPVCGMEVEEKDATYMTHMEHETYYFCSKACQETFEVKEGLRHEGADKKWWQRILKEPKGTPPKCH